MIIIRLVSQGNHSRGLAYWEDVFWQLELVTTYSLNKKEHKKIFIPSWFSPTIQTWSLLGRILLLGQWTVRCSEKCLMSLNIFPDMSFYVKLILKTNYFLDHIKKINIF